jgi:very-short-patch-repair endonuclease
MRDTQVLRGFARGLRREATDAERRLWSLLRNRQLGGFKFRRQVPIGPYIADFICFDRRLIIEADGGQHADSAYDEARDAWLRRMATESCAFRTTLRWSATTKASAERSSPHWKAPDTAPVLRLRYGVSRRKRSLVTPHPPPPRR